MQKQSCCIIISLVKRMFKPALAAMQALEHLSAEFAERNSSLKQQALLQLLNHSVALGRHQKVAAQAVKALQTYKDELLKGIFKLVFVFLTVKEWSGLHLLLLRSCTLPGAFHAHGCSTETVTSVLQKALTSKFLALQPYQVGLSASRDKPFCLLQGLPVSVLQLQTWLS